MTKLPDCGLYRTLAPVAGIPAGRLVYFHNHGDPGPGFYFPESWTHNRAKFSSGGTTAPPDFDPRTLQPLPAEGFYRVTKSFFCCAKQCVRYEPEMLVQLGYNGTGKPLVFMPELGPTGMAIPERGTAIDDEALVNLVKLAVNESQAIANDAALSVPRGIVVH
jgi:hypothetical protein